MDEMPVTILLATSSLISIQKYFRLLVYCLLWCALFIPYPTQWLLELLLYVVFLTNLEDPTPEMLDLLAADYTTRLVGCRPINHLSLPWTVCSCLFHFSG